MKSLSGMLVFDRLTVIVLAICVLLILPACGNNSTLRPPPVDSPARLSVTVTPNGQSVGQGATQRFSAVVSGTADQRVTWSIQEGAGGGSIDAQGNYTAPTITGAFHVVATSVATPVASGAAVVNVVPPGLSVTVSPGSFVVDQGATIGFSAVVNGTADQRVNWSIQEGSGGGSIDAQGVYTAPATAGTFHIVATSVATPAGSGVAPVSVNDVWISIDPYGAALVQGGSKQFQAVLHGTVLGGGVTWSVQEGSVCGSVTSTGLFTAAGTVGSSCHVIATGVTNPNRAGTVKIWIDAKGFTQVGDMVQSRVNHTATRLLSGDVLIAGGVGQAGSPDPGSEIFNAATSTFHATSALSEVRYGHTATLLANGKVLVVGGQTSADACSQCTSHTAEIYDPATQTFTPTGNMLVARSFHTAVLLPDGRVVIAGGFTEVAGGSSSVEIYDPTTGQFGSGGKMTASRVRHASTLLLGGRVFIAGGEGDSSLAFTGDIFDPGSGQFTKVQLYPRSRNGNTVTVLSDGRVLLGGGGASGNLYSQTRIFDPTTKTTSPDIAMFAPRMFHTATMMNGGVDQVLLTGGNTYNGVRDTSTELFESEGFRPAVSMIKARANHSATMLSDGSVLVTGGSTDRTAEVYK